MCLVLLVFNLQIFQCVCEQEDIYNLKFTASLGYRCSLKKKKEGEEALSSIYNLDLQPTFLLLSRRVAQCILPRFTTFLAAVVE